jgi:transposase
MKRFRDDVSPDEQCFLLPPSVGEFIGPHSPARVLAEVVDTLDLHKLYSFYPGGGAPAYDPRVMVKIWLLALMLGVRSSRRIADLLMYDMRFMFVAKMARPDFRTLCRFRKVHGAGIQDLFVEVVRVCQTAGMVILEDAALDGTKIEASASRKQTYKRERLDRTLIGLQERIAEIMAEVEATDAAEDAANTLTDEERVPKELRDVKRRKERLEEAKRELGRTGRSAVAATDTESRVNKTSNGLRPSFNAQAMVDGSHQIIVAADVTQDEKDHAQLPPLLEQTIRNTGCAPGKLLADTGYQSDAALKALEQYRVEGYVKQEPVRDGEFKKSCTYDEDNDLYAAPDGTEFKPAGTRQVRGVTYKVYRAKDKDTGKNREITFRQDEGRLDRMRDRLETTQGKAIYRLRQQIVEPVFGHLKDPFGLRRLLLRGLQGATNEFLFSCTAHNMYKLVRFMSANRA